MVARILWGLFWLILALWVIKHPHQAADAVHGFFSFLSDLVS